MDKIKEVKSQKKVKFGKMSAQAIPELWMAHFVSSIILVLLTLLFMKISTAIIGTKAAALTTANAKEILLSWQGPVLIIIAIVFVLVYAALDLFLRIYVTGGILRGEKAGIFKSIAKSLKSIKLFINPSGISILVYILFAVPIVGIGFSVSLTENFAIPNFIMEVLMKSTLFKIVGVVAIVVLLVLGFLYFFSLHGVLLSGLTPKEAKKYSVKLMKKNWKKFLFTMIIVVVVCFFARVAISRTVNAIFQASLNQTEESLPSNYEEKDFSDPSTWTSLSDEDSQIMSYRVGSVFSVLEWGYLDMFLTLICSAIIMLYFTKLYLEFDAAERGEEAPIWLSRPMGKVYIAKNISMVGIVVAVGILSFALSVDGNSYILKKKEPAIFAHRSCGTLGFENSVEGLKLALDHGCIGGEIDIQRTKDGYYIINHDNDFARLAGVSKKPSEMTLAEIEALELKDDKGEIHKVPKLEEFLAEAKRLNCKLLLELKGETADEQMADDVVAMVKEYDVEDLVIYISLKENVMNYLKEKYPESYVSSVFFGGIGNFGDLPCDLLGMEEGMASPLIYYNAHSHGKTVDVWTPNSESSLHLFMDSDVDYITTDEVELSQKVRKDLDSRSEREIIKDRLQDFWSL
ncbi:MAG: glycerophosphoryl diester phosphodiesterase membrane domain-containing protein [Parasporobacterium sp.]|nr:glycerophosphoryl diester phosphodiesterase membrane domain-containing protein [Parasporobacterium sp.]